VIKHFYSFIKHYITTVPSSKRITGTKKGKFFSKINKNGFIIASVHFKSSLFSLISEKKFKLEIYLNANIWKKGGDRGVRRQ
jgi:hypothetical protein